MIVTRELAWLAIVRRFARSLEGLAFWRFENKAFVALVLHPRMPKKAIIVRTMTALGTADVRYGNEPMLGKLLNEPHHVPARAVQFLAQ